MILFRGTRYDGSEITIIMENVLFFGENDKGGTVFIFGAQQPDMPETLLHEHVTQSETQVLQALGAVQLETEEVGEIPNDKFIVNQEGNG